MTIPTFSAVAGLLALAACSSPPKPPTVDDSKKRPVNVSEAVDLQICRTELSAAKIVLTETLATQQHPRAVAPPPPLQPQIAAAPEPNHVFVITFPFASADLTVPAEQRSRLIEQARAAQFIVIRGRTDSMADSMAETRLARRRAEAAYDFLIGQVRLPPEGIRLSWQGAGDPLQAGAQPADRQANRRVEIELYPVKPAIDMSEALTFEPPGSPA